MEYTIQHIVFPTESKHLQCRELFYRGDHGYYDDRDGSLALSRGQFADFATYFNACSYAKWRRYTYAGRLTLHLDIEGRFAIRLVGYSLDQRSPVRRDFALAHYDLAEREVLDLAFPENDEMMLGFEVSVADSCVIHGGCFTVECAERDLNDVNLCIATTTCRKEDFIVRNVQLIKDHLLSEGEIREHLFVHVVDNGRTLTKDMIEGYHVWLHPNNNAGGSGGYARGMIEAMHQSPEATHVLLMDDDVLILPDSLRRTYALLRLVREEYRDYFISGAMLYYESPFRQHEDVGTIDMASEFVTRKKHFDHRKIKGNLENEDEYSRQPNEFNGWWYCCVPASAIRQFGLPLPLFIGCDDVEYSIRCDARFITMNGICIWHMGFARKFNAAREMYQRWRNMLISQACSGAPRGVNLEDRFHKTFRMQMLKYDYDGAELMLRALEDYLKGPAFIKEDRGEQILKENSKLNARMQPLSDFPGIHVPNEFASLKYVQRSALKKWLLRLTYNGHILWPERLLKKDPGIMSFDFAYNPEKITLRRQHLAVNPYARTGCMFTIDKKRFRALLRRFDRLWRDNRKNRAQIIAQYQAEAPYLKSEAFWREYLKLDRSR